MLSDNRGQVVKMATGLERRLKRQGHLDAYNKEVQGYLDRGAVREISQDEMDTWGGDTSIISPTKECLS